MRHVLPALMVRLALVLITTSLTAVASDAATPQGYSAGNSAPKDAGKAIPPTVANVGYGPHARQRLDFWKAAAQAPTPVVIFLHGGSWQRGTRTSVQRYGLERFLAAGVSVVAADYRFIDQARDASVTPPVQWPLADAARVVQFVRSKAPAWELDSRRFGLSGSSAGACSALWVGMHDDSADPSSADPIARESSRVACVGVNEAQTSLDPQQIRHWFGQYPSYGLHAFGFNRLSKSESNEALFLRSEAARESLLPWIRSYSPYEHASADDPPIVLYYPKKPPGDTVHGAMFGVKLQERLAALGGECRVLYPGSKDTVHADHIAFLIAHLQAKTRR